MKQVEKENDDLRSQIRSINVEINKIEVFRAGQSYCHTIQEKKVTIIKKILNDAQLILSHTTFSFDYLSQYQSC